MADRVMQLTRDSPWQADRLHTGRVRRHITRRVWSGSATRITSPPSKSKYRRDGCRVPTAATTGMREPASGHLFKFDASGHLIADFTLGEGTIYHPGGIDYDGTYIWVPVAEYRPNSRSIVYRVNPETMQAEEVFRFKDHIGAIVHDTDSHTLHGVSWGSRRFYRWKLERDGTVKDAGIAPERLRTLNTSHYVDYQDCKYAGRSRMLCTGVTELRQKPDAPPFRLGGIDLVEPGGRSSAAPGSVAALDRRRHGHDAQPGLARADRDGSPRLLHARRQHLDALHLRGHTQIVPGCQVPRCQQLSLVRRGSVPRLLIAGDRVEDRQQFPHERDQRDFGRFTGRWRRW